MRIANRHPPGSEGERSVATTTGWRESSGPAEISPGDEWVRYKMAKIDDQYIEGQYIININIWITK